MLSPHIAFASHMWGSCMGELIIEARVVSGGNWTTIFYQSVDRGNQWIEEDIPLPGFAGEIVQFKIIGVTGHCYKTDIAIDGFGFFDHCISNYHVGGNLFLGAGTTNYTEVDQQITMDAKLNTGHMILDAGNNILFQAGAEVKLGATIHAYIDGCDSYNNSLRSSEAKK